MLIVAVRNPNRPSLNFHTSYKKFRTTIIRYSFNFNHAFCLYKDRSHVTIWSNSSYQAATTSDASKPDIESSSGNFHSMPKIHLYFYDLAGGNMVYMTTANQKNICRYLCIYKNILSELILTFHVHPSETTGQT